MAYDQSNLSPIEPESLSWALAYTRFILRDTGPVEAYSDTELTAALELHQFESGGIAYYRPHAAAAALIRSDPERALSEGVGPLSTQYRTPEAAASAIERDYAMIDARIEQQAGVPFPARNSFRVVF